MPNGTKSTYRPNNSEPMSQGTRCHQLGEYVVFFSPLNMLCDSPTHYEKETECTDFIASIPVIWDETVALDSKVGEYVAVARRSGSTWYVGGLTNWTARDITLDLSFIGKDNNVEAYLDGPNAAKFAQDYAKTSLKLNNGKLNIHMAPGGGFALKIK
jgi:alpha-glucosidase